MAAGLNKVFLIGNLTRDPELRYTANGLAVASFTVASNRNYATPAGEKKTEATFMRIVAWGKRGETCAEFLSKGSLVFVEGRIQNRSWQGQDGTKRTSVEVVASNVQFLGAPKTVARAGRLAASGSQEPRDIEADVDVTPEQAQPEGNNIEDSAEGDVPF